jgi:hypothetical protein
MRHGHSWGDSILINLKSSWCRLNSIYLRLGLLIGPCEHDNELSGFINDEFVTYSAVMD